MGGWLEAFEDLPEDKQARVRQWIVLNEHIARALEVPWENWIRDYVQPCIQSPLDLTFFLQALPGFRGYEGLSPEAEGVSFSREADAASALTPKIPVRAKNNLGRLSASFRIASFRFWRGGATEPVATKPSDVAQLQKILRRHPEMGSLKRKDFRRVVLRSDGEDIVIAIEEERDVLRLSRLELAGIMRRPLV